MRAELPRPPWYSHRRQWLGIGMALVSTLLVVGLALQQYRFGSVEDALSKTIEERDREENRRDSLRQSLTGCRELLARYQADKEQCVRDIADFRHQLDLLTRKTQSLERVHSMLRELEAVYERFRASERRFLDALEQSRQRMKRIKPKEGT